MEPPYKNVPTQILASESLKLLWVLSLLILNRWFPTYLWINHYGQLGMVQIQTKTPPLKFLLLELHKFCRYHSLILKTDGSLHAFGYNNCGQLGMEQTLTETHPQILSSESLKSLLEITLSILKTNGSLHVCGANSYGQLGMVPPQKKRPYES